KRQNRKGRPYVAALDSLQKW
ncbi:unnamed protein product, partial [Allacma fusca]